MRNSRIGWLGFVLCAMLVTVAAASAQENKEKQEKKESRESAEEMLEMEDLPPAVRRTVRQQIKGARMVGLSAEKENGATIYELETKVRGHGRDLLIDAGGSVLEIEEEVEVGSLPAAVRTEIEKNIADAKLLKFESVTKRGRLSGYEALVERNGKKTEISMGPDGRLVKGGTKG